ncbi:hypothetical protein MXB_3767, partial [Myxobolus squamalis]
MITGCCPECDIPVLSINGKSLKKNFLFEIVCNNQHGIDTDKMDYLSRDARMIGFQCGFNYKRFLDYMCISIKNDGLCICFQEKLYMDCH